MVDATRTPILLEPNAPGWAQRLALRLTQTFLSLFPTAPARLWTVASADLPPAADWRSAIVWCPDKGKVAVSDGTTWLSAGGGPL